ncbi:MAG: PAS domain-containing protein, partial [Spirochaetia bacterium]|nr:PAS domain-containing protein [Spirochaetia bacterium]
MNNKNSQDSAPIQDPHVLAALIENSNDIALVKDLDRRILSGNANFVRSTGRVSLAELIGKRDADILGVQEDEEPAHSLMLDDLQALSLP